MLGGPLAALRVTPYRAARGGAGAAVSALAGTAGAAAAAFAQLAAVRREQRRAAEFLLSSAMSTTLEDVVHELVRPMLGGWLNAKLPEVIDRVVQDEIARMNADAAD